MGIVNGISIVNNLLAGSLSGAQLQTYLVTGSNAASFVQVVNVRRQLQMLRNTPTAVAAVLASAAATLAIASSDQALRVWALYGTSYSPRDFVSFAAMAASSAAMTEIAESGPAMALLAASSAAMTVLAASSVAMTALTASTAAMTALAASPTAMTALAASSSAMATVAGSPTAMAAVIANAAAMTTVAASSVAMTAVAASSTAMSAVIASPTAMTTVFASTTAKTALYDSATASTAIFASASAKAYLVSIALSSEAPSSTDVAARVGKTYFLQQKVTAGFNSAAGGTAGSSTYATASSTFVDRFVKLPGLYHRTGGGAGVGTVTYIAMA